MVINGRINGRRIMVERWYKFLPLLPFLHGIKHGKTAMIPLLPLLPLFYHENGKSTMIMVEISTMFSTIVTIKNL